MKLGEMIKAYRQKRDLSLTETAEQIGIAKSTLHRIEVGKDCDLPSLFKLLNWMITE